MNGSQKSEKMLAACFWLVVIFAYTAASLMRGVTLTGDGPVHWVAAVYAGSCSPSFLQLMEMYGIPGGPVPYLIWGNLGNALGYSPLLFRAVCTVISLLFAFIYWLQVRKNIKQHYMVIMLLLTHPYFFLPSHSVLTDNFGLFFLAAFFGLVLARSSVPALKGALGFAALCLALYSRIWYLVFPFAFIALSILGRWLGQRTDPAKAAICLMGILSIGFLPIYWGGFVQPSMQFQHHVTSTSWLPVLVVSTVGAYLWPLSFLMRIKRVTWIMTGVLSPLFLAFPGSAGIMKSSEFIGGLSQKGILSAGEYLFGSQYAEWVFLPFWIIGLAILLHMIMSAYSGIRKAESLSESPLAILCVAGIGFLAANMMVPYWTERYLSPFFLCIFPFIPQLIKRWEKVMWLWIGFLAVIAAAHLLVHASGYKRSKVVEYKGVEATLEELYMKKIDRHGNFYGDEKIEMALSCLRDSNK